MNEAKTVGKVLGPCEITAIKAESAQLRGFDSVPVVKSSLASLNSLWLDSYTGWLGTADLSDFSKLHSQFQEVYQAIKDDKLEDQKWLSAPKSDEKQAEIRCYQECLLRAMPIKVAANAMLQQPLAEECTEKLEVCSKNAAEVVQEAPKVELALATIVLSGVLLEKPRPKDFQQQYAEALQFATSICKIKVDKMPATVGTMVKAEEAAKQPKKQKTTPGSNS